MKVKSIYDIDFAKRKGLLPVIVQDKITKDILMLAYVNEEALRYTIKTGNACFWSTSRNKLWIKGEESGNFQPVKEILLDCDMDYCIKFNQNILLVIRVIDRVFIIRCK